MGYKLDNIVLMLDGNIVILILLYLYWVMLRDRVVQIVT